MEDRFAASQCLCVLSEFRLEEVATCVLDNLAVVGRQKRREEVREVGDRGCLPLGSLMWSSDAARVAGTVVSLKRLVALLVGINTSSSSPHSPSLAHTLAVLARHGGSPSSALTLAPFDAGCGVALFDGLAGLSRGMFGWEADDGGAEWRSVGAAVKKEVFAALKEVVDKAGVAASVAVMEPVESEFWFSRLDKVVHMVVSVVKDKKTRVEGIRWAAELVGRSNSAFSSFDPPAFRSRVLEKFAERCVFGVDRKSHKAQQGEAEALRDLIVAMSAKDMVFVFDSVIVPSLKPVGQTSSSSSSSSSSASSIASSSSAAMPPPQMPASHSHANQILLPGPVEVSAGVLMALASIARTDPATTAVYAASLGVTVARLVATEGGLIASDRTLLPCALACFPHVAVPDPRAEEAVVQAAIALAIKGSSVGQSAQDAVVAEAAMAALSDHIAADPQKNWPPVAERLLDAAAPVTDPAVFLSSCANLARLLDKYKSSAPAPVGAAHAAAEISRRLEKLCLAWLGDASERVRATALATLNLLTVRPHLSELVSVACPGGGRFGAENPRATQLALLRFHSPAYSGTDDELQHLVQDAWEMAFRRWMASPSPAAAAAAASAAAAPPVASRPSSPPAAPSSPQPAERYLELRLLCLLARLPDPSASFLPRTDAAAAQRNCERFLRRAIAMVLSDDDPDAQREATSCLSLLHATVHPVFVMLVKSETREKTGLSIHREVPIINLATRILSGCNRGHAHHAPAPSPPSRQAPAAITLPFTSSVHPLLAAQLDEFAQAWIADLPAMSSTPLRFRVAACSFLVRYLAVFDVEGSRPGLPRPDPADKGGKAFVAKVFSLLAAWWPRGADTSPLKAAAEVGVIEALAALSELAVIDDPSLLRNIALLVDAAIMRDKNHADAARGIMQALLHRNPDHLADFFHRSLAGAGSTLANILAAAVAERVLADPAQWFFGPRGIPVQTMVVVVVLWLASEDPCNRVQAARIALCLDTISAPAAAGGQSPDLYNLPLRTRVCLPATSRASVERSSRAAYTEAARRWSELVARQHPGFTSAVLAGAVQAWPHVPPASRVASLRALGPWLRIGVAHVVASAVTAAAPASAFSAVLDLLDGADEVAAEGEVVAMCADDRTAAALVGHLVTTAFPARSELATRVAMWASRGRGEDGGRVVAEALVLQHLRVFPRARDVGEMIAAWAAKFVPAPPTARERAAFALCVALVEEWSEDVLAELAPELLQNAVVLFGMSDDDGASAAVAADRDQASLLADRLCHSLQRRLDLSATSSSSVAALDPAALASLLGPACRASWAQAALAWAVGCTDKDRAVASFRIFTRIGGDSAAPERVAELGKVLPLAVRDDLPDIALEVIAALRRLADAQPTCPLPTESRREALMVAVSGLLLDGPLAAGCLDLCRALVEGGGEGRDADLLVQHALGAAIGPDRTSGRALDAVLASALLRMDGPRCLWGLITVSRALHASPATRPEASSPLDLAVHLLSVAHILAHPSEPTPSSERYLAYLKSAMTPCGDVPGAVARYHAGPVDHDARDAADLTLRCARDYRDLFAMRVRSTRPATPTLSAVLSGCLKPSLTPQLAGFAIDLCLGLVSTGRAPDTLIAILTSLLDLAVFPSGYPWPDSSFQRLVQGAVAWVNQGRQGADLLCGLLVSHVPVQHTPCQLDLFDRIGEKPAEDGAASDGGEIALRRVSDKANDLHFFLTLNQPHGPTSTSAHQSGGMSAQTAMPLLL